MIGKLLRALGVVVSLTGTLGAEPFRPGDRYLSKTQLAEQGPIKVRIDEKRAFKVLAVEATSQPEKSCRIDMPSLKTLVASRIGADSWDTKLSLGAKLTFELKTGKDSQGELICMGDGTGCKVTIESAARPEDGVGTTEDLSAARINREGYAFDVAKIGRVRLSKVTIPPQAAKGCRVNIPSVIKLLEGTRPAPGVKVTVGLKLVYYGDDDWGCKGGGSDCKAEVEIP